MSWHVFGVARMMRAPASEQRLVALALHLPLAMFCAMLLLAGRFIPLRLLPRRPCLFLHVTGLPCPLCGYTRGIWLVSRGAWQAALLECPLSLFVYGALVLFLGWNMLGAFTGKPLWGWHAASSLCKRHRSICWLFVTGFLLANWLYRLASGLQ